VWQLILGARSARKDDLKGGYACRKIKCQKAGEWFHRGWWGGESKVVGVSPKKGKVVQFVLASTNIERKKSNGEKRESVVTGTKMKKPRKGEAQKKERGGGSNKNPLLKGHLLKCREAG